MAIRVDPEGNETHALFRLAQLDARDILEVGCGDGRLTWRYAEMVRHLDAIDPFQDSIAKAREALPSTLENRIRFHNAAFAEFSTSHGPRTYDTVILSWSLC